MSDEAQAVSRVPKPRDILLVPQVQNPKQVRAKTSRSLFEQNWQFGQQWQAAKRDDRVVLELPFGQTLSFLEQALNVAAVTARQGHDIALLTGHGVAQTGLSNESAFDTLPERGKVITHKHTITSQVLELPTLADNKDGRWIAKKTPGLKSDPSKQALVDAIAPRFDMLVRVGAVFEQQKVGSFTVLSCNVGRDSAFQSQLAKLLKTKVRMYEDLLAMGEEIFSNPFESKELAWLVPVAERANPERSRPSIKLPDGSFDRNHIRFREFPPGLRTRAP